PSSDVWALGVSKRQLVYFPKGDWTKGRIVCEGDSAEPCKSFLGPFHLAIDQQDRIWVSNSADFVIRFPASDPAKAEKFKTGINNSGLNIDSQGNVSNAWVSNFAIPNRPIVQLCGVRTENGPPGLKPGDQISPPSGYIGGGLQMQTDLAIDPAGNVWVMNNWQDIDSCFGTPPEALSTRCGGQGVAVFYGMAKPVRAPQIGPAQAP